MDAEKQKLLENVSTTTATSCDRQYSLFCLFQSDSYFFCTVQSIFFHSRQSSRKSVQRLSSYERCTNPLTNSDIDLTSDNKESLTTFDRWNSTSISSSVQPFGWLFLQHNKYHHLHQTKRYPVFFYYKANLFQVPEMTRMVMNQETSVAQLSKDKWSRVRKKWVRLHLWHGKNIVMWTVREPVGGSEDT